MAFSSLASGDAGAQSRAPPSRRIVGGAAASISQYPWQAAVVVTPAKGATRLRPPVLRRLADHLADRDHRGPLRLRHRPRLRSTGSSAPASGAIRAATGPAIDPNDVDVVLGRTTLRQLTRGGDRRQGVAIIDFDPGTSRATWVPRSTSATWCSTRPPHSRRSTSPARRGGALGCREARRDQRLGEHSESGGSSVNALRAATVTDRRRFDLQFSALLRDRLSTPPRWSAPGSRRVASTPAPATAAGRSRRRWTAEGLPPRRDHELGRPLRRARIHPASTRGSRRPRPGSLRDDVVAEVAELESTYALTPEDIVGSGGRPLNGPQTPPPPAKSEPTPVVTPRTGPARHPRTRSIRQVPQAEEQAQAKAVQPQGEALDRISAGPGGFDAEFRRVRFNLRRCGDGSKRGCDRVDASRAAHPGERGRPDRRLGAAQVSCGSHNASISQYPWQVALEYSGERAASSAAGPC